MKNFCIFFFLLFFFSSTGLGNSSLDMDDFSRLPVLHEGRIKPLDSMARADLRFLSGREDLGALSASEWLAEVFFAPQSASVRPVFKIDDPTLAKQMKLPERRGMIFSFEEILPGLDSTKDIAAKLKAEDFSKLDSSEKDLLNLHEKALLFLQLTNSDEILKNAELNIDLGALARAYVRKDIFSWQKEVEIALKSHSEKSNFLSTARMKAELFYNASKPWVLAQIIYAFLLAVILAGSLLTFPFSSALASVLSITALAVQGSALALRIFILQRPPVGSLYESLLFVSFAAAMAGFLAWRRFGDRAVTAGGASVALFLLCIAPYFAPAADSLEVLPAVLNTNFWLATHVICITFAYALCIVTACLSHIALFKRAFDLSTSAQRFLFEKRIGIFVAASLFFTSLGTALGGIWADQSWGRFWGWDPKENGALLIILWIVWLMHGRWSGHIGPQAYLGLLCGLNMIVAFSWIGVNLLGAGLHSYGFTQGMAAGLALFCLAEFLIIASLFLRLKTSVKK